MKIVFVILSLLITSNVYAQELDTRYILSVIHKNLGYPTESVKYKVVILDNKEQVVNEYRKLQQYSQDKPWSFYNDSTRTIYIAKEYYTYAVLGHELTHAVISQYFVQQVPMQAQEVQAGYIEFEITRRGEKGYKGINNEQ